MAAVKLDKEAIQSRMKDLPDWKLAGDGIERDFVFDDFNQAFGFLTRIAMLSEKLDHHAEWSGVYNKVHIRLSTHDAGGLTNKDIQMAGQIDLYIG